MEKTPFWKKTWFIVMMLWIVPPIGIALMLTCKKEWKKAVRIIISVIFGIWFLLWCALLLSPSGNTSADNDSPDEETTTIYNETNGTNKETTTRTDTTNIVITEVAATTEKENTSPNTTKVSATNATTTTKAPVATTKPTTTKAPITTAKPTTTKAPTTAAPATTAKPTTTAPATTKEETNYVLNTNTMKFHKLSCGWVDDIDSENIEYFKGDRETLISNGFSPCGKCHP